MEDKRRDFICDEEADSSACRSIHDEPALSSLIGSRSYSFGAVYPAAFFACARNFAHRRFAALEIFALAAADNTRFLTVVNSRLVVSPNAFAAALTLLNWRCIFANCFLSFRSSRLIAARKSILSSGGESSANPEWVARWYCKRQFTSSEGDASQQGTVKHRRDPLTARAFIHDFRFSTNSWLMLHLQYSVRYGIGNDESASFGKIQSLQQSEI
jgi:hypothetical protein